MPVIRPAVPADEGFLVGLTSRLADFDLPPWRTSQQIADADPWWPRRRRARRSDLP